MSTRFAYPTRRFRLARESLHLAGHFLRLTNCGTGGDRLARYRRRTREPPPRDLEGASSGLGTNSCPASRARDGARRISPVCGGKTSTACPRGPSLEALGRDTRSRSGLHDHRGRTCLPGTRSGRGRKALFSGVKRMPIGSPMGRRTEAASQPANTTVASAAALSLLLFASRLGEIIRSL